MPVPLLELPIIANPCKAPEIEKAAHITSPAYPTILVFVRM